MTPGNTVTGAVVYIVDDDVSVRRAMTRTFQSLGFQVAAFGSAREFLEHARADLPGCLILDVRLPGLSGIELQEELTARQVDLPIVFMTGHGNIPMTVKAMRAGAVDFLPKPVDDEQLINTVCQAIDRHARDRQEFTELRRFRDGVDSLTPREFEVMTLVVAGLLNKQIAKRLGITEHTVKVHRGRVMAKVGMVSVAELARLCERSGILTAGQ